MRIPPKYKEYSNKEFIENILDFSKNNTIVIGYTDIIKDEFGDYKMVNNDWWVVVGNLDHETISQEFLDNDFDVKEEGVYEYKAIIKHISSSYEEPGELCIDYINLIFIQTILSRDREQKLFELLYEDSIF